jgi:hypothetical protein
MLAIVTPIISQFHLCFQSKLPSRLNAYVFFCFRKSLGRSIHGVLVDVAEDRDVLGRNTSGRALGVSPAATAAAIASHVREAAASAGDHRDVQLVVEVPAPQEGRRTGDNSGSSQSAADQLASGYPTLSHVFADPLFHGVLLRSSQFTLHPFAACGRSDSVPVGVSQTANTPENLRSRLKTSG